MGLTDAQRARRQMGIGGSDIGAIVGVNRFSKAIDVYAAKVEGRELEDNFNLERGRFFEQPTAEWRIHRHGGELISVDTVQYEKHPVVIVHPDFLVEQDNEVIDLSIKSPGPWAHEWGEPGTDEVPPYALVQAQYELAALKQFGVTRGEVAAVIDGDLCIYPIGGDEDLQAMLVASAEKFHRDHVLKRVPPAPDASENYETWLKTRHPKSNGKVLPATPESMLYVAELARSRAEMKAAEARVQQAKNQLMAIIGDADGLEGEGWKISFRQSKGRETTDWRAVCMEAQVDPSLVKRFSKRTPFRVFKPSGELFKGVDNE